ncbi:SPASM domain-containing protein [Candidatus Poribacteria bacterium]|nr:SPASM domain-containing protein [Candidatus Poribacteria bacterium]
MTINATLLTEEIVDFIQRYRFGLKISLNGPPEVQDYFRPFQTGRGSYEVTERKVKMLMKKRRSVSARPTLTHSNLAINDRVEFFEKLGFTRVGFGIATGKSFQKSDYDLTEKDLNTVLKEDDIAAEDIFQRISQGRRVIYNPFDDCVRDIHQRHKTRIRCGLGRGCRTVSINGEFYPCHRFVGMEKYIIGDISSGIDKGKVFDMLRNYYRTKDACRGCWAKHICGGACPWYVAHEDGSFRYPDRAHCNSVRASLEQSIWFYQEIKSRFPDYFKMLVSEESPAPVKQAEDVGKNSHSGESTRSRTVKTL